MNKLLANIEFIILSISLSVMSIITFANVVSRYLLHISISFTSEITVNLFIILTFVGASAGIYRKAHLGFTLLFDSLSPKLKIWSTLLTGVIVGATFSLITYLGIEEVIYEIQINQTMSTLGWPKWIFSLGFPIGTSLCLIRIIQVTWIEIRSRLKNEGVLL